MARASAPAHVDLWSDRALVVAPLASVSRHRHAAAALLLGLDGDFCVRFGRDWRRTRSAWIPAGVAHELQCGATLIATLYLFPLSGDPEALAASLGVDPDRPRCDVALAPEVRSTIPATLLAIHGGDLDRAATRAWLSEALIGARRGPTTIDARVHRAAALLREHAVEGVAMAELAAALGVSQSRLMHLFKAGVGVPVRRYRLWERMRLLTEHVAAGESLTMAALAAGFADSAHLSHGFRGMFGIPASRVLNPRSRLRAGLEARDEAPAWPTARSQGRRHG